MFTNARNQISDSHYDNDLTDVLKKDLPADQTQRNEEMIENAASSDGWRDYHSMLDPIKSFAPRLTAEHAKEFILNLSKDHFLNHYLQTTSRSHLRSKASKLRRAPRRRMLRVS